MIKTVAMVVVLVVLGSSATSAACRIPGRYKFYPAQNDSVTYNPVMDSAGCGHTFNSGGSLAYTSASILTTPKHGLLRQRGAFSFGYKPNAGFKGQDTYAVKLCGTSRAGSGCSTVNYLATIQ